MTAVRYRDEVQEPIMRLYAAAAGPTLVLIDDNACSHRAVIVDDYLDSERIARMAWTTYSPHHQPIENLLDAFGHLSSNFSPSATLIKLKSSLLEEWGLHISAEVDHLIESTVTRCKFCIQVRGGGGSHTLLMSFFHFMLFIFTLFSSV